MNIVVNGVEFSVDSFDAVAKPKDSDRWNNRWQTAADRTRRNLVDFEIVAVKRWRNLKHEPQHGWDMELFEEGSVVVDENGNTVSFSPCGGAVAIVLKHFSGSFHFGISVCSATENFNRKVGDGKAYIEAVRSRKSNNSRVPSYRESNDLTVPMVTWAIDTKNSLG